MKRTPIFAVNVLCLFLLHIPGSADDVKLPTVSLKGGKTYEGVTLKKISETEARLMHASGVATVGLADLPSDVAKALGYSPKAAEAILNAQIKAKQEDEERIANALDFKGLRLRMSIVNLPAFIEKTLWSYDNMDILMDRVDLTNPNTTLKFGADCIEERERMGFTSEQASEFTSIGRDGIGENAFWYAISETRAQFVGGQLAQIKVYGPAWSADELKSNTLRWLELAELGITQKYGKPAEVIIPIDKFSILNADSGYVVHTTSWKLNDQTIYLGVLESKSRFTPVIVLYDDKLKKSLDELGEGKANF